MSSRSAALSAALLALLASCGILGSRDEEGSDPSSGAIDDRVGVVSEAGPFDPAAAVDDADDPTRTIEEEAAAPPPAAKSPDASAEEAQAQEQRQEKAEAVRSADQAGGEDEGKKVALAHNPAPEPTPEGESAAWTTVDVLLDGLLVAAAALVLSLLLVNARTHKRTVAAAATAGIAALAYLWWQAR